VRQEGGNSDAGSGFLSNGCFDISTNHCSAIASNGSGGSVVVSPVRVCNNPTPYNTVTSFFLAPTRLKGTRVPTANAES
jgi:hypothetical protein